jgi:CRISPR system Cascade subunit CasE
MLYLSRLVLNRHSRLVVRDLGSCQELHRTILSAFPSGLAGETGARHGAGVLFRLDDAPDGRPRLLVQSRLEPDWSRLPLEYLASPGQAIENPACKRVDEHYDRLRAGQELLFRLRANPTKKIDTKSAADGERRNGRRVLLTDDTAQREWLQRKATQHGFSLLATSRAGGSADVRAGQRPNVTGFVRTSGDPRTRNLTFGAVLFDGRLRIADAPRFRDSLEQGIGSGKAYGFGLLSVANPGGTK